MAKEFIIRDKGDWQAMVNIAFPVVGKKPFRVILHRGLKRTIDQNKLLHAVFTDCANKVWAKLNKSLPADWWKRELKAKLGKKSVHFDLDEQPTIFIDSTSDYSTKEMSDFCQKIVAHMKTEHEVDIELPDELKSGAKS